MPFQRFKKRGEKGHESSGTDAIGGVPDQEQRVLDVWSVLARTGMFREGLPLLCMVEKPHGVRAIVSSCCCKGIKQLAFLLDGRCLAVPW
jgi:hypothetical protein